MDLGIAGKTAIVCASSRGLGRACALALAGEGVEVTINGRDAATLAETADAIREATRAKVAQWHDMVKEVHETGVSDPVVAGSFFSVSMTFDLTFQDGNRNQGEQIAVYEVRDGKVVREQFFYSL